MLIKKKGAVSSEVAQKMISNLYNITKPEIPEQIQKYIDNDEKGMSLLKLVELIREDRIKDLGSDSLYFIIETLNRLKINKLRNSIILDVVPLKV